MEYISDLNCPTCQAQIARLSFITKNWGGGRPPSPPPPPASYAYDASTSRRDISYGVDNCFISVTF